MSETTSPKKVKEPRKAKLTVGDIAARWQALKSAKILGEIVTFNPRPHSGNGTWPHSTVVEKLKEAGLNEKVARELLPQSAFSRAIKKLEDQRSIEPLREDPSEILFQFTKKFLEGAGDDLELKHQLETKMVLNKVTGKVTCKVKELENLAQKELDRAMAVRTTSDITKIVNKLYEANADLIPFRDQGGVYIVFKENMDFNDRIYHFLRSLGGNMVRFNIADTEYDREEVAVKYTDYSEDELEQLREAIKDFTVNTKGGTLSKFADRIKEMRVKLKSRAMLLRDKGDEILKGIEAADKELAEQIERIGKAKEERVSEGHSRGKRAEILGHSATAVVRWCAKEGWSYEDIKKMLAHYEVELAESTISSQMVSMRSEWRGKAADLSSEQIKELNKLKDKKGKK